MIDDSARDDILQHYSPPFDLLSDMVFAFAFSRAAPLAREFPGVPFLSLAGWTPLAMWFSRVRKTCYYRDGERGQLGADDEVLYNELNVVALLRERSFFVPAIYATSELTIRIGHQYGMPKQGSEMSLDIAPRTIRSAVRQGRQRTEIEARVLEPGRLLAQLARLLPYRTWPVLFPDRRTVRPLLLEMPRIHVVGVSGRLALGEAWLPTAVPLLPVGIYLPSQRMELPPPPVRV